MRISWVSRTTERILSGHRNWDRYFFWRGNFLKQKRTHFQTTNYLSGMSRKWSKKRKCSNYLYSLSWTMTSSPKNPDDIWGYGAADHLSYVFMNRKYYSWKVFPLPWKKIWNTRHKERHRYSCWDRWWHDNKNDAWVTRMKGWKWGSLHSFSCSTNIWRFEKKWKGYHLFFNSWCGWIYSLNKKRYWYPSFWKKDSWDSSWNGRWKWDYFSLGMSSNAWAMTMRERKSDYSSYLGNSEKTFKKGAWTLWSYRWRERPS